MGYLLLVNKLVYFNYSIFIKDMSIKDRRCHCCFNPDDNNVLNCETERERNTGNIGNGNTLCT